MLRSRRSVALRSVAIQAQVRVHDNVHRGAWTGRKCSGARDHFVACERLDSVGDRPQRAAASIVQDERPLTARAVIDISPRLEKAGKFVEHFYREQVWKCCFRALFHRTASLRRLTTDSSISTARANAGNADHQGFLHLFGTYISKCIVPFRCRFHRNAMATCIPRPVTTHSSLKSGAAAKLGYESKTETGRWKMKRRLTSKSKASRTPTARKASSKTPRRATTTGE